MAAATYRERNPYRVRRPSIFVVAFFYHSLHNFKRSSERSPFVEYLIYCDESEKSGELFTNFYGGALVRSTDYHEVVGALEQYKAENNLMGEMKWTKVTAPYVDKYKGLMDVFFDFVQANKIKMRVMFQQKEKSEPRLRNLTKEQRDDSFFILYYQFFKHAFGLAYSNPSRQ